MKLRVPHVFYLIKKSIEKGYISKKEFNPVVNKAYSGIIKKAT